MYIQVKGHFMKELKRNKEDSWKILASNPFEMEESQTELNWHFHFLTCYNHVCLDSGIQIGLGD